MAGNDLSVTATSSSLDTSYQDLPGYQSYAGDPGYSSAPWPTPEQTGLTQPIPQQPLPPQRDPYSEREGLGHMGTPVPLYSVPATHMSVTSGDGSNHGVAVTGAPGARAGEEMPRTHPSLGKTCQPGGGGSLGGKEASEGGMGDRLEEGGLELTKAHGEYTFALLWLA